MPTLKLLCKNETVQIILFVESSQSKQGGFGLAGFGSRVMRNAAPGFKHVAARQLNTFIGFIILAKSIHLSSVKCIYADETYNMKHTYIYDLY